MKHLYPDVYLEIFDDGLFYCPKYSHDELQEKKIIYQAIFNLVDTKIYNTVSGYMSEDSFEPFDFRDEFAKIEIFLTKEENLIFLKESFFKTFKKELPDPKFVQIKNIWGWNLTARFDDISEEEKAFLTGFLYGIRQPIKE